MILYPGIVCLPLVILGAEYGLPSVVLSLGVHLHAWLPTPEGLLSHISVCELSLPLVDGLGGCVPPIVPSLAVPLLPSGHYLQWQMAT